MFGNLWIIYDVCVCVCFMMIYDDWFNLYGSLKQLDLEKPFMNKRWRFNCERRILYGCFTGEKCWKVGFRNIRRTATLHVFQRKNHLKQPGVDPLTTSVGRSYKSFLVRRWHMVLQAWPSWDLLSSACPWWHDLLCQINKQPSQLAPYWRTNISLRHTHASALHCHVMPSCILMQQVIQHESNMKHGLCDPFHH